MVRTFYTPDSNFISLPIPDRYIGTELEISVLPINEVFVSKTKMKTPDIDISFGGWEDMNKTTDDICSEIRASRTFRNSCARHGLGIIQTASINPNGSIVEPPLRQFTGMLAASERQYGEVRQQN